MHKRALPTGLSIALFIGGLVGIQTVAVTPAVASVATCAQGGACAVGDIGPAGGRVFYASVATFSCGASMSELCNYLEAAPKTWSGSGSDPSKFWQLGAQQTVNISEVVDESVANNSIATLGLGYKNSIKIVDAGNGSATAAGAARAYTGGSKSDWYLPNNAEMNFLCQWARGVPLDSTKVCTGGTNNADFSTGDYWTSSEYNNSNAWRTWMGRGNQTPGEKNLVDSTYSVRPIRSFSRSCAGGGLCKVGDIGPGGGRVYYVAPTTFACGPTLNLTCKYLEVAQASWNTYYPEPSMVWSTVTTGSITGGGTAIGTGYRNTLSIISQGAGTSPAGERVRAYRGIGPVPVSDWYMASIDELEAMWRSTGSIGFGAWTYASSSEELDYNFGRYNIRYYTQGGGGSSGSFPKTDSGSPATFVVKPVRAFSAVELTYTPRTITFDGASLASSYSITDSAPTVVANVSAGTGAATFASSTASVCTINSSSGLVSFVSAGICTISASVVADSSFAAATTSRTVQISKLLSTVGLTFSTPTATYRQPIIVTLSSSVAGRISLRANGKAVNGCIKLAITTSRTCSFKPSSHSYVALTVVFSPTNSSSYSNSTTSIFNLPVMRRTSPR
ncbi:hypothetical protein MCEMRE26_00182 [Candidatus Nanopelagicaceae bacterium]